MKITVGGLKGGVGKTTTAVHLAFRLAREGRRVLLVDADPVSQSAADWLSLAIGRGEELGSVQVLPWATPNLGQRLRTLDALPERPDDVVIDTGGDTDAMFRAALAYAPELFMPCRPHGIELRRVPATITAAREVMDATGVVVYPRVLFVAMVHNSADERESRSFLLDNNVDMFAARVPHSVQIARNFGHVPVWFGAYNEVYAEISPELDNHAKEDWQ